MSDEPSLEELLAWSMDAEPELLPLLPGLFADLEDLGARAVDVVEVLRGVGLDEGARVLDLGCGKGAVAIALAREFGCMVHGVDGMPPFVRHAEERAAREGLVDRCLFVVEDVRATVRASRGYDAVCLLALGDLFGSAAETVAVLRECVRPGGLILIDDAYLADGAPPVEGLENCFDHAATVERLGAHGDELLAERVIDGPESREVYDAMTAAIVRRAEALASARPDAASLLRDYVERQTSEVDLLTGPVIGALWVLRRADPI